MSNEIEQAQADIVEEFSLFDDWMGRYEYLIELGKELPEFPEEKKTEEHKIKGCQSQVWFIHDIRDGRLHLQGISDAAIVSGLIAVLLKVYGDRYPRDILSSDPNGFIQEIGFDQHLSPTRSNGLHSMIAAIFGIAKQAQSNFTVN